MSKDSHPFSGVSEGAFEDFAHEKYNQIIWLVAQFGGYTAHHLVQYRDALEVSTPATPYFRR
jgi:hypothetical protein